MQTGRKILNLRCDRKITQQELARACGITPSALSKIEAGINSPRANVLWRIAKNLGVTVEYLLDEEMPYPYPGYSYRQDFLARNEDPTSTVRIEVTKEEGAFLEALRKTSQVARDIAFGIPEGSVETLRLVHFLLNHTRIKNPSQSFLASFESLLSTGNVDATPKVEPPVVGRRRGRPAKVESRGAPKKGKRAKHRAAR
jgi:transcriptional regulator with XRE-family HTH domain